MKTINLEDAEWHLDRYEELYDFVYQIATGEYTRVELQELAETLINKYETRSKNEKEIDI